MTTENGKKTQKTGKTPARRGRRKKIVAKAPAPAEIDKQKMAAFFSAAGLDEATPDPVTEKVEVDGDKKPVLKEPESAGVEVVTKSVEVAETSSDSPDDNSSETSENVVTAKPSGSSSDAGSFNLLPMVFVLVALAVGWFYYISSTPMKKAVEVQVGQGQAEISVLMSKIKGLEAEVARLKVKLVHLEKSAKKANTSVKSAAVLEGKAPLKAPKPFWSTLKVKPATAKVEKPVMISAPSAVKETLQTEKIIAKQKPASAPVLESSFDKAPKPFWLKE